MPPHGGFAIGLERWVARLAGAANIREVTLFPATSPGSRRDVAPRWSVIFITNDAGERLSCRQKSSTRPVLPSPLDSADRRSRAARTTADPMVRGQRSGNVRRPVPGHAHDPDVRDRAHPHLQRDDVVPLRLRRDLGRAVRDDRRCAHRAPLAATVPRGVKRRSGVRRCCSRCRSRCASSPALDPVHPQLHRRRDGRSSRRAPSSRFRSSSAASSCAWRSPDSRSGEPALRGRSHRRRRRLRPARRLFSWFDGPSVVIAIGRIGGRRRRRCSRATRTGAPWASRWCARGPVLGGFALGTRLLHDGHAIVRRHLGEGVRDPPPRLRTLERVLPPHRRRRPGRRDRTAQPRHRQHRGDRINRYSAIRRRPTSCATTSKPRPLHPAPRRRARHRRRRRPRRAVGARVRPKSVTGVEINGDILDIVNGRFGDFTGHLDRDPRGPHRQRRGAQLPHRTDSQFDIIQISLIDTWAATSAGAFALSENSLYTTQRGTRSSTG